jgi:hypothetical protein
MRVIWNPCSMLAFPENNCKPPDLREYSQGPEVHVIWKHSSKPCLPRGQMNAGRATEGPQPNDSPKE